MSEPTYRKAWRERARRDGKSEVLNEARTRFREVYPGREAAAYWVMAMEACYPLEAFDVSTPSARLVKASPTESELRELERRLKSEEAAAPRDSVSYRRKVVNGADGPGKPVLGDQEGRYVSKRQAASKRRTTIDEDFLWVYQNFVVEDLVFEDAPSPGAWALLHEVRDNKPLYARFIERISPKDIQQSDGAFEEDMRQVKSLDKVLHAASEAAKAGAYVA